MQQAQFTSTVTVDKLATGVYLLGGGPANSYMVEFDNFVAVFEAPGSEERSLQVIEQIVKLAPGKPVRWLISSHPHWDHIGGIRTYNHIGATIVMHMKNLAFFNRDILNYVPRTVKPDIMALWPPTEVAEGYNYEAIQENFVITDNTRILRVYYVQPLRHVEGMLMAYLPAERIAFEADLFDTHEPHSGPATACDDESLEPGEAHEARRGDPRARARQAGSLGGVPEGDGPRGESLRRRRRGRVRHHGAL